MIDAGETALVEGLRVAPWERGKGVAGLLQRFCSQLVKRQHPGVKVVRLTRDDQLGPRELKKYRLITKQVRRTRGPGWPVLSPLASGVLPQAQPVIGFLSLTALLSAVRVSSALRLPVLTKALLLREVTIQSQSLRSSLSP